MSDKKELTIEEKAREYADSLIYPRCFIENNNIKRASNILVAKSYERGYYSVTSCFRWRKVEEEMPEVGEDVLIMDANDRIQTGRTYMVRKDEYRWITTSTTFHKITHWMPIPPTP